ncbi:unnamed protein product, partial [Ectocarpus sp. 12 AP-2014]
MNPSAADQHEGPLLLFLWAGGDPLAKKVRPTQSRNFQHKKKKEWAG